MIFIILSILFIYFLLGGIIYHIILFNAPTKYKEKLSSNEALEVITIFWPYFLYVYLMHIKN
jgi:hypothetical protein